MGTSLARPLIAKKQIEIAKKENTNIVSHGATGKGNDQVRFELTYHVLMPDVEIIAPWKNEEFLNEFKGRPDMIAYCKKHNIPVKATKDKPYSTDPNLMHMSYEGGILEDPNLSPTDDMFELTVAPKQAPDKPTNIGIEFKDGIPVSIKHENTKETKPLEIFQYLNKIGGLNGIGREDVVENRFVGMKSRGVYETPAGTILIQAHLDIEGLTMDREVKLLRDSLIPKYAQLIYNGFWYSPEFGLLTALMNKAQENITGKVYIELYKGNVIIKGRESPVSLYSQKTVSFDEIGDYDQKDAKGFIKLNALRLKASAKRKQANI